MDPLSRSCQSTAFIGAKIPDTRRQKKFVRQAFFGPVIWPVAALIGVGLGIGFLVMSGHSLPSMLTDSEQPEHVPVMVVTCFAATMACWAIVRGWHLPPRAVKGDV